jgi:hypothetical protein
MNAKEGRWEMDAMTQEREEALFEQAQSLMADLQLMQEDINAEMAALADERAREKDEEEWHHPGKQHARRPGPDPNNHREGPFPVCLRLDQLQYDQLAEWLEMKGVSMFASALLSMYVDQQLAEIAYILTRHNPAFRRLTTSPADLTRFVAEIEGVCSRRFNTIEEFKYFQHHLQLFPNNSRAAHKRLIRITRGRGQKLRKDYYGVDEAEFLIRLSERHLLVKAVPERIYRGLPKQKA